MVSCWFRNRSWKGSSKGDPRRVSKGCPREDSGDPTCRSGDPKPWIRNCEAYRTRPILTKSPKVFNTGDLGQEPQGVQISGALLIVTFYSCFTLSIKTALHRHTLLEGVSRASLWNLCVNMSLLVAFYSIIWRGVCNFYLSIKIY